MRLPAEADMDTEVRLAKVEVEVENCKEALEKLNNAVDELRASMDRNFAETRASQAEIRREMHTGFRWLYGLLFANMTCTFGIIVHLAAAM